MRKFLAGLALAVGLAAPALAASFPDAISTDATLWTAVNNCYTTLSVTVSASTPVITAAATASFPTAGYVLIESEVIRYTGKTSGSFTGCTRGADGTAAATHTAGKLVYASIVAAHHNSLKDEIKAIENYLIGTGTDIHVDTANHRLGVNNGSPAQALDVTGNGNFTGSLTAGSTVGGAAGSFTGEVAAGTLNTGHGSNELYPMDQDVQTTASPTWSGVTSTHGIASATAAVSGLASVGSLKVGTGGSSGYVLTDAAGDGNAVWQSPSTLLAVGATIVGADANGVLFDSAAGQLATDSGFTYTPASGLTVPSVDATTAAVDVFRLGTSATAGRILVTDASGYGTWQTPATHVYGRSGSTDSVSGVTFSTITVPANTLNADGKAIRIRLLASASDIGPIVQVNINGGAVFDMCGDSGAAASTCQQEIVILRTGSGTQETTTSTSNFGSMSEVYNSLATSDTTYDDTADIIITTVGTGDGGGASATQNVLQVEY